MSILFITSEQYHGLQISKVLFLRQTSDRLCCHWGYRIAACYNFGCCFSGYTLSFRYTLVIHGNRCSLHWQCSLDICCCEYKWKHQENKCCNFAVRYHEHIDCLVLFGQDGIILHDLGISFLWRGSCTR